MTRVLVWSGATGAGNGGGGETWNDAYVNLSAARTALGAGNHEYLVAHDHVEPDINAFNSQYATGHSSALIMSVERDGATLTEIVPTPGAEVTKWNDHGMGGNVLVKGLTVGLTGSTGGRLWQPGFGNSSAETVFEDCVWQTGTPGTHGIRIGQRSSFAGDNNGRHVIARRTQIDFGAADQVAVQVRSSFTWEDTDAAFSGGAAPSPLFNFISGSGGAHTATVRIKGVDLSNFSGSLFAVNTDAPFRVHVENCRLHASVSIVSGTIPNPSGDFVEVHNCGVNDSLPRSERYDYGGTGRIETTVVRTGTAAKLRGTDCSWRMGSNANAKLHHPHVSQRFSVPIAAADTGAARTYRFELVSNNNVTLDDGEMWIEAMVMDTSGHVVSSVDSTRKDNPLAAGTALAAGVGTGNWTTTGMTDPVSQRIDVTVTPEVADMIEFRVFLARPSHVVYLDFVPETV